MTPYAYTAGCLAAFDRLGLSKLAAIGAKTMLPPPMVKALEGAAKEVGSAAQGAARSTESMLPAAMRRGPETLADSPWHQFMEATKSKPATAAAARDKQLFAGAVPEMSPAGQYAHVMGPSAGAAEVPGSQWVRDNLSAQLTPQDVGALRGMQSSALQGAEGAGATVRPPRRRPPAPPAQAPSMVPSLPPPPKLPQ